MKKIVGGAILTSLCFLLITSCNAKPSEPDKKLCKYKGCKNEVSGWDNYKTDGSYSGPKYQGSFQLKTYGGSFCSQDHAIHALD
jgi:hypothetical protein